MMDRPTCVHVVPDDDLREHEMAASCWCHPRCLEDGAIIAHNAMDQRELYEKGERRPS